MICTNQDSPTQLKIYSRNSQLEDEQIKMILITWSKLNTYIRNTYPRLLDIVWKELGISINKIWTASVGLAVTLNLLLAGRQLK